jgi:hypothetical protein
MLKYTEIVLLKVSFNRDLFKKELIKALKWLKREDAQILKTWCIVNFGTVYLDVINEAFH